jgi:uncharacterized NAD(P)/FAD-binding protein YdhS
MLSNIASVEIPPLEETLVDWLHWQSDDRLLELRIDREQIDDHVFYPRVLLGEYFYDQLQAMLERATRAGVKVHVRTRCEGINSTSGHDGMTLVVRPGRGHVFETRFDHVVLATGHQWPDQPEVRPGYFLSPWPASEIEKIRACRIGIRGSSLTAIDAAVALAISHGELRDRISLLRDIPDDTPAQDVDPSRLVRQQPGATGLGTSRGHVKPPPGWTPPKKPDPMTKGRRRSKDSN